MFQEGVYVIRIKRSDANVVARLTVVTVATVHTDGIKTTIHAGGLKPAAGIGKPAEGGLNETARLQRASHLSRAALARDTARGTARHGQALVELTLTLGIILTLVFCSIAAMQIILTQDTVAQAARAAAHQAALAGGPTLAETNVATGALETTGNARAVVGAAQAILDGAMTTRAEQATIRVTCGGPGGTCARYEPITVTIAYQDVPWAPVPPFFTQVRAEISATRAAETEARP
jgi:Flp pilus assembly protein TadG